MNIGKRSYKLKQSFSSWWRGWKIQIMQLYGSKFSADARSAWLKNPKVNWKYDKISNIKYWNIEKYDRKWWKCVKSRKLQSAKVVLTIRGRILESCMETANFKVWIVAGKPCALKLKSAKIPAAELVKIWEFCSVFQKDRLCLIVQITRRISPPFLWQNQNLPQMKTWVSCVN